MLVRLRLQLLADHIIITLPETSNIDFILAKDERVASVIVIVTSHDAHCWL